LLNVAALERGDASLFPTAAGVEKKLVELVQGPAHLMDVVEIPATNVNISEEQAGLRVCMPLLLGFVVAPARARMRGYAHERESCRKRALRGGAE
jgi:hypothetical protein